MDNNPLSGTEKIYAGRQIIAKRLIQPLCYFYLYPLREHFQLFNSQRANIINDTASFPFSTRLLLFGQTIRNECRIFRHAIDHAGLTLAEPWETEKEQAIYRRYTFNMDKVTLFIQHGQMNPV
ncbi:hypothetical protein SAMN06265348_10740 [Pedobacter westerhofensis]|uniref:Uncharacterized protein n=1 Tax=Pedobacter westerhofensis TaxID=425512 RepID=A0A521E518_9SPHI|nr:hypothetical protein SAMN06265348_10740 [Pedobacter westerhofensis]